MDGKAALRDAEALFDLGVAPTDIPLMDDDGNVVTDKDGNPIIVVAQGMDIQEVAIANLKYEQGFGMDNALMKGLNLEGSSDTILGVIAAEENLTEVEAQVANIRYSYIMARNKFHNDAAMLED